MTRTRVVLTTIIAVTPLLSALILVEISEPFPSHWLNPDNPHYWPNLLRAVTFLVGGTTLGMIFYVMVKSVIAEVTVTGGHPRKKLYSHVSLISAGHGLLMVTLLFYIRDRIDYPLSPATPVALAGLGLTILALARMLQYQNSRLRNFHSAKQIVGTIAEDTREGGRHLCVTVDGVAEPVSLSKWLDTFDTGEVVLLTVEKVEESPDTENKLPRLLRRREDDAAHH